MVGTPAKGNSREQLGKYAHRDWAREQRAAPACQAAISNLERGCTVPFHKSQLLLLAGTHTAPLEEEVLELVQKGVLCSTDEGIVLFLRKPTPAPST